MRKGKLHVVRPAGVTGDEIWMQPTFSQLFLQQSQRLHRQLVILCQRRNKAVAAVRAEPDSIAGKEIFPVHKVYHVPPCMTGNQKTLDPDAVNVKYLPIVQQYLFVVDRHLRQFIEMIDDFSPHLAGEIPVLDLADVQLRIPEQPRTICFHCAHMVGVLMGDKDMVYRLRINPKPAHFFGKAVIVVSGIDHNGRIAFAVEEDVRHPFAHAGNILVDPAGVQRLEDLLAPVHPAHCFSLKFRCFFRHDRTSFLCCDAQPALFIFVVLDLTKSCLLQIRFTVHNAILFTRCAHCSG